MSEDSMLKCLIAFILGFLISRMMQGNGFHVGGARKPYTKKECLDDCAELATLAGCMGPTPGTWGHLFPGSKCKKGHDDCYKNCEGRP